jgi:hypothetical protein
LNYCEYDLLEKWRFDTEQGRIVVHLLGIKPRFDKSIRDQIKWPLRYKSLFWVRYEDVSSILRRYYQYHPLNNLSTAIWQSYFLPDKK